MIRLVFLFFGILIFNGCYHENKIVCDNIHIDLDNGDTLLIDSSDIVWLETNDSSTIYDISNILWIGDKFIVQSRMLLKLFDKDGTYIRDIAKRGDAPDEFLWIGNLWEKDSIFYLCDYKSGQIKSYDIDGNYLGYEKIESYGDSINPYLMPEEIYKTDAGDIYYINSFIGTPPFCNLLGYKSNESDIPKSIEGRKRKDGVTFYNRFYADTLNKRALYWEHLNDTLFEVTPDKIRPLYHFDYGEYNISNVIDVNESVGKKFRMLDEAIHSTGHDYAYPARYFQMAGDKILFITSCGKKGYIVIVDELQKKGEAKRILCLENPNIIPQLFFNIKDDSLFISVIDESNPEGNPGLFKMKLSDL